MRACAFVFVSAWCSVACSGQVFDLKSDWSDTSNPNGAWSYNEGVNVLPKVMGWQNGCFGGWATPQDGWAENPCNNMRLPFWYKSNGTETFPNDIEPGDVIVHSTDPTNGAGNGLARVVWTAPSDGIINVSGAIWLARNIGRGNHWRLIYNGTIVTGGTVFDGDPYSRANPMGLEQGSGGMQVLSNVPAYAGKSVVLELERTTSAGEFTGINLTIELMPGSCYADCDHSMVLNLFDFLCFVNEFNAGGAYADCDGSGTLDLFDFLCFVNEFNGGCAP